MVVPYTKLAKMVEADPSIYKAYTDPELFELLAATKKIVPEYCRIIRVLRDFPSDLVLKGSKTLNMRQLLKDKKVECKCIRCREIKDQAFDIENTEIQNYKYQSNQATEYFISVVEPQLDKLIGLVRLRCLNNSDVFIPELKDAAIVRELHVYGKQESLSKTKLNSKSQHLGLGTKLMQAAEAQAKLEGYKKIAVISAIGTREYYKKLGYHLDGSYMLKEL